MYKSLIRICAHPPPGLTQQPSSAIEAADEDSAGDLTGFRNRQVFCTDFVKFWLHLMRFEAPSAGLEVSGVREMFLFSYSPCLRLRYTVYCIVQ